MFRRGSKHEAPCPCLSRHLALRRGRLTMRYGTRWGARAALIMVAALLLALGAAPVNAKPPLGEVVLSTISAWASKVRGKMAPLQSSGADASICIRTGTIEVVCEGTTTSPEKDCAITFVAGHCGLASLTIAVVACTARS